MSRSLKCLTVFSFFFILFLLPFHFIMAEQAAWGGNGGWWGGGNREWIGDYDGPGYTRYPRTLNYSYFSYHHYHRHPYHHYCAYYPDSPSYYYDSSVPGAGLYLNLR